MKCSELIKAVAARQKHLTQRDVDLGVKTILSAIGDALSHGKGVELRGFGSFRLRYRRGYTGRNPRSGQTIHIRDRYVPHFKPGRELRRRVNDAANKN